MIPIMREFPVTVFSTKKIQGTIITGTCCVKIVLKNQSLGSWFLLQTSLERQQFRYDATGLQHG